MMFQAHLISLDQQTKDMVLTVNAAIGSQICAATNDVRVITGGATMNVNGNQVST